MEQADGESSVRYALELAGGRGAADLVLGNLGDDLPTDVGLTKVAARGCANAQGSRQDGDG